jgi:ATP-dependent exoDNAse (exonuclease V) alpha subunit
MIAGDAATVADLNRRARADRVAAGEVTPVGVEAAGSQIIGVGDIVVTRQNDRRLFAGGRWVKNGDRWTVTAIRSDGGLSLRRLDGGSEVQLTAAYVSEHVELAYATTAYQAQGRTVDTAHALVSPTTTREVLYVSASRGRESNRLYVDASYDPDPDTGHGPATTFTSEQVLIGVLANRGAEQSAHEVLLATDSYSVTAKSPQPTWRNHDWFSEATDFALVPDC